MGMLAKIRHWIMQKSRGSKSVDFFSEFKPGMTVLDVGVSGDHQLPHQNYFLKNFPYDLSCYTGLGIDSLDHLEAKYPQATFVTYDGKRFPFKDRQFDWVFSNAVIEHVGDAAAQRVFVQEMQRVAKRVFFTTPNKFFPIETHTNILFLHWIDSWFYTYCRTRKPWIKPDSLKLLSRQDLHRLLLSGGVPFYTLKCNRFMGWTMTFTVKTKS
jgi:ubiquinone/menaquinone biosynthesis C-methylase UbiE